MSIRYLCRVAKARASPAVCGNPIRSSAAAATPMVAYRSRNRSMLGSCGVGSPRGRARRGRPRAHLGRTACEARIPPATSTRAPGMRAREPQRRITPSDNGADQQRRAVDVAQRSDPRAELPPGIHPVGRVPVSFGSSPITTSTAAPARKPVITGWTETARSIPAERRQGAGTAPRDERDRGHQLRRLLSAQPGQQHRSAGNRGKGELGPVEICRDVPNVRTGSRPPPPRTARSATARRRYPHTRGSWGRSTRSPRSRRQRRRAGTRGRSEAAR